MPKAKPKAPPAKPLVKPPGATTRAGRAAVEKAAAAKSKRSKRTPAQQLQDDLMQLNAGASPTKQQKAEANNISSHLRWTNSSCGLPQNADNGSLK